MNPNLISRGAARARLMLPQRADAARPSEWRGVGVVVIGLAMLLLWDISDADWLVTQAFATPQGFPWREHQLARAAYDVSRWVSGLSWLVLMLAGLRPGVQNDSRPTRRQRVFWLLVVLACWLLVPAYKRASLTSCPWDQAAFGGIAIPVSHWRWGVPDGGAGHCFPSGHATTGFGYVALYFLWRDASTRLARLWLALALVAGLLTGGLQVARGAHYVSHVLWSAWGCWLLCWLASWVEPWLTSPPKLSRARASKNPPP